MSFKEYFSFPDNDIDLYNILYPPCQVYTSNDNSVKSGKLDGNICYVYSKNNFGIPEVKSFEKGEYAKLDPFRNNHIWNLTEEYNKPNLVNPNKTIKKSINTFVVGGETSEGIKEYVCYARIIEQKSVNDETKFPSQESLNKLVPGITNSSENTTCNVVHENNLYEFPNFKILRISKRSNISDNRYLNSLYIWKNIFHNPTVSSPARSPNSSPTSYPNISQTSYPT